MDHNIRIIISTKGGKASADEIKGLGTAASSTKAAVDQLRTAMQVLAGAVVVNQIRQAADTYTEITNRLRLVTRSTQELTIAQKELFRISQQTRSDFLGNVVVYTQVAKAAQQLGVSQTQLLKIQQTLAQSVTIGGTSAEATRAGLFQLAQGFSAGALRGQEFNSVVEQLPGVARLLEAALRKTTGELRVMANDGELTTDVLIKAFQKMEKETAASFSKIQPSISSAFTVLNNAVIEYIGRSDQATGTSAAFASAIIYLANNVDTFGDVLLVSVAAFAAWQVSVLTVNAAILVYRASIAAAMAAQWLFNAAVTANPLGILIVALGGATVAYGLFAEKLEDGRTVFETMSDLASRSFGVAASAAEDAGTTTKLAFTDVGSSASKAFKEASGSVQTFGKEAKGSTTGVGDEFTNLANRISNTIPSAAEQALASIKKFSSQSIIAIQSVIQALNEAISKGQQLPGDVGGAGNRDGGMYQFRGGGVAAFGTMAGGQSRQSKRVGGAGGSVDSQLVSFWASPGETLLVLTPEQRAAAQAAFAAGGVNIPGFRNGGVATDTGSVSAYSGTWAPTSDMLGMPTNQPFDQELAEAFGSAAGRMFFTRDEELSSFDTKGGGLNSIAAGLQIQELDGSTYMTDLFNARQILNQTAQAVSQTLQSFDPMIDLAKITTKTTSQQDQANSLMAKINEGDFSSLPHYNQAYPLYDAMTKQINRMLSYQPPSTETSDSGERLHVLITKLKGYGGSIEFAQAIGPDSPYYEATNPLPYERFYKETGFITFQSPYVWNTVNGWYNGSPGVYDAQGWRNGLYARDGLDMVVPGAGAVDSRIIPLHVSPGEQVSVKTHEQQRKERSSSSRSVQIFNMTVNTPDANSFRRSTSQMNADFRRALWRTN